MTKACAAYGCTTRGEKGVHMYQFPLQKKELLAKWLVAMRRKDFAPSAHAALCEKYFEEGDFWPPTASGMKKLRPGTVPSKFDFPAHLQTKARQKRAPPKVRGLPPVKKRKVSGMKYV